MVEILLKRYLWLVDTLKEGGEMTYDEIADKWGRSSVNDNGTSLSKRTFYNHCQAIARHFGIDIECRRGRGLNLYRIANPEAIEENSLVKWAMDSFSLGELLLGNAAISDKILLEDVPSGRQWLKPILKALQENREIEIDYENFFGRTFTGTVRPLCVKLFKRRWYMLVFIENGEKRKFSLDRIKDLTLLDTTFKYPSRFNPSDHFEHFYGINAWDNATPEKVVVRAYAELPGYLRSLPLHHSQREIKSTEEYTDFSMELVPTFDFEQELLLHRDQIEVLQPQSLRDEMAKLINRMTSLYHTNI